MSALAPMEDRLPARPPGTAVPAQRLTPRQLETLKACVRTGSQKAAAADLGVCYQTVKNTLAAVNLRLGVSGMVEALWVLGWLTLPGSGRPPCGWTGSCSRVAGHAGPHRVFREITT